MTEIIRFNSKWSLSHYVVIERTSDAETSQQQINNDRETQSTIPQVWRSM